MVGHQPCICTFAVPPPQSLPTLSLHHPLFLPSILDGENIPSPELPNPPQPTANNSSSNHPCRLIAPSLLNFQSPSKVQAAVSSLVASLAFLDEYQTAAHTGKARLLDGSTQHGLSAWHVRMPKSFRAGTRPDLSYRAADLLACPPHLLEKNCVYRAISNQVTL